MTDYKPNRDGTVAVALDYYWQPITADTPLHIKLQLLTKYGVAQHGALTPANRAFYTHWTPLPRKPT